MHLTVPNLVEIGQTLAKVSQFYGFSKLWRASSWIFKNANYLQSQIRPNPAPARSVKIKSGATLLWTSLLVPFLWYQSIYILVSLEVSGVQIWQTLRGFASGNTITMDGRKL